MALVYPLSDDCALDFRVVGQCIDFVAENGEILVRFTYNPARVFPIPITDAALTDYDMGHIMANFVGVRLAGL